MKSMQEQWLKAPSAAVVGAARWIALLVCAVAVCAGWTGNVRAQTSQVRAAFNDVSEQGSSESPPNGGELRIAVAPKPVAAKTTQPVVQKAATPPAHVRQSPSARPAAKSTTSTETLPMPPNEGTVPLAGSDAGAGLQLSKNDKGLITLVVRDKSLSQVLALIAQTQNLNIVASNDIDALISITLRDVPIEEALTAILSVANYTWVKHNNIILITSLTDANNLAPDVQGRQVQVFDLDFASATAVDDTVKKLLSPVGKSTIGASNPADNRRTQERIVVEDVPGSLARIADYIAQVDQAPRQVQIEAHVLQVDLDDTTACGVNFNQLFRIAGARANIISVPSAAVPLPSPGVPVVPPTNPAMLATLGSTDLQAVVELLQTTIDAKVLGSPKLLVLNEQEARIQVGRTLYFKQVTTTQTSSQQGAGSVEAGVILRIKPRITRDHRVLLHVSPEVSTPDVGTPPDGLPPNISKTTLETDVMLKDNEGMVIGGLINEQDQTDQSKVPYLGNMRGIGFLFRHSEVTKKRSEIIVALMPRIQPYDVQYHDFEQGEFVRASVPLFHGPLCRTDRPWDPVLPDGKRISYPLIPKKHEPAPTGYFHNLGPRYAIPPYPLPNEQMCDDSCAPMCPAPGDGDAQGPLLPSEQLPTPAAGPELPGSEIISDQ
ncbi:MAG TPA: hypothetical protein VHU84_00305 [Lacipirellulaceae bacterium]|jgi:type II secretory pathway component GspD/PulD (secretin)|nr:hypothetical protein [Lacipirellulaceae bacterium]